MIVFPEVTCGQWQSIMYQLYQQVNGSCAMLDQVGCVVCMRASGSSYPGLISGGFGKGFVKFVFPTSQYVSSIPLPWKRKRNPPWISGV